jgi:hypothetical protein
MGDIPAKANQPAAKFQSPTNMQNLAENQDFTIKMAIQGMQTGAFVNPNTNYFGAPQALNAQGQIIGHSHVVVQAMKSLTDTTPLDPTVFAFFQYVQSLLPVDLSNTSFLFQGLERRCLRWCSLCGRR